ncbi:hypothetical protein DFH06DRAFT_1438742 [Mycena polygramma]|nr:hypothetical protein DFH06DRAFT_1438742 [Mycena polygramma]
MDIQQQLETLLRLLVPPADDSCAPHHLFESNDLPSEPEIQLTRDILVSEETRLRVLDENFALVQSVLVETLDQRRHESREKIRMHKAVISPLRHLPPELLGRIFLLTLPDLEQEQDRSFRRRMARSPWVLTRICSRWRKIAISLPSLWTTITLAHFQDPGCTSPLDMLKTELLRSANAPLSIIVPPFHEPSLLEELALALTLVLESSARWESLEIPTGAIFCKTFSGQVPLLRKLYIGGGRSRPVHSVGQHAQPRVLVAPALRDIALHGSPFPLVLPWAQMTRYEAVSTWSDHLAVLPLMVQLREAHLCLKETKLPSQLEKRVVIPTLRKLYLRGADCYPTIPDNLVVPALEDLWIDGEQVEYLDAFPWLRHSPCRLKRLAIATEAPAACIIEFFRCFPTITELTITGWHDRKLSDVLRAMEDITILPNLKRLAISLHSSDELDAVDTFMSVLHIRSSNALKFAAVTWSDEDFLLGPDLRAKLKQVSEEQGVHVSVDKPTAPRVVCPKTLCGC